MSYDYCTTASVNVFTAMLMPTGTQHTLVNYFRIMQQPGIAGLLADVYDDIVSIGSVSDQFVWGLPFFLEKRVFLVQTGRTPKGSGRTGP